MSAKLGAGVDADPPIADARQELELAREQLQRSLEGFEQSLLAASDWRAFVRARPFLSVGAAMTAGYLVALLSNRRRDDDGA